MASQPSTEPNEAPSERPDYLWWSRDPAVALLSVVPLWLVYEGLRLELAPAERNGAEALVTDSLDLFGPRALLILEVLLALAVLASIFVVLRRKLPWGRIAAVSALEGTVYGLLLGPVTQILTFFLLESGALALWIRSRIDAVELVGSLGAGLFEEAVFRLLLVSFLSLLFARVCIAFSFPRAIGVAAAVVAAAITFAWFHHVGPGGEPLLLPAFMFRMVAGLVLGLIFVTRGFAVVVYAHATYDVHYYFLHD